MASILGLDDLFLGELAFAQRLDEGEAWQLERPRLLSLRILLQVVQAHQVLSRVRDLDRFRLRELAVIVSCLKETAVGCNLGGFTMN